MSIDQEMNLMADRVTHGKYFNDMTETKPETDRHDSELESFAPRQKKKNGQVLQSVGKHLSC